MNAIAAFDISKKGLVEEHRQKVKMYVLENRRHCDSSSMGHGTENVVSQER
jgi:hypothetical protein